MMAKKVNAGGKLLPRQAEALQETAKVLKNSGPEDSN
jgi:hypothetical protein